MKRLPEHPKRRTFPIPRVLMVRIYRKEAIFDSLSTKESIIDANPFENEYNFEGEVREQSGS